MKNFNYPQLYSKISKDLSEREKDIISQRFGIVGNKFQTLESIGDKISITRERVRQIIEKSFSEIREKYSEILEEVFQEFKEYFKKSGGFKREKVILRELGGEKCQSYILFLLNLGKPFSRTCGKKDFYSFWMLKNNQVTEEIKKIASVIKKELKKAKKPQKKKEFIPNIISKHKLKKESVISFLEISKEIKENQDGEIGLIDWAEISPKGVKDKSYLVLRKESKPLHFREVARLIDERGYSPNRKTLSQTVHNELIKDSRFVLVGRGTYALREWGYIPGTVKDVISKILRESKKPLTEKEVIEKVLEQRTVAKNTVLINLHNQGFTRDSHKRYTLKDVQTA